MFFYASSKHLFYGEGCIKLASGLSGTVSSLQDAVDKVSWVTTSQRPFLR